MCVGDEKGDFRALFIRAPAILSAGDGVEVLAEYVLPEEKKKELADKSLEKIIVAVGSFRHPSWAAQG